jgi:hypothetical protein
LETLYTQDPREFWREIRNLGPRKSHNIPLSVYDENGTIDENINHVLNKWKDDFHSLLNPNLDDAQFNAQFYNESLQRVLELEENSVDLHPNLNENFTIEEVRNIIKKAKNGKAVGIEGIPNEVLKNNVSVEMLHSFFNKVFCSGLVPNLWRLGIIKPLPKSSLTDPRLPLQYRGIALLSTIYKLYTGLLNNRLIETAEAREIYVEEQNGFRKKRSCVDHIYSLTTILRHKVAANQPVFSCFVDAEKAFDRIDRKLMFLRLLELGVCGKYYWAIKSIYKDCQNCVNLNGFFTTWFNSDLGVKQGDVISPTLFGLFINDLIKEINGLNLGIPVGNIKISALAFADDIVVLGNSEQELQEILNTIANWGSRWRMSFNCTKSNVVHFRKKNTPKTKFDFTLGGLQLNIVDKYKYLGVILNDTLDYSYTAEALASAGGRALGAIINKYKKANGLGFYTYSTMYKSCVYPILEYSSEIWGYKEYQIINKVQNRAIRTFLGVNNLTSNLAIHGDFGWTPPRRRRHLAMIRYYNRLVDMENYRLPKIIFCWEKTLKTHGWAHEVKSLMSEIGLLNEFTHNVVCNLNTVWAELFAKECSQWKTNVQSSRKLRTYKLFKHCLETEPYVYCILNKGHRSVLARLRAGALPLQIETGRWRAVPPDERFCMFCEDGSIEDECHFIFDCKLYYHERQTFFHNVASMIPNFMLKSMENKLSDLMSKGLVNNFGRYLFNIYQKCHGNMYN